MLHPVMRKTIMRSVLFGLAMAAVAVSATDAPNPLSGLHWRSIGPSRGGRVLAVTGVAQQPQVFYFGAVVGGVWKPRMQAPAGNLSSIRNPSPPSAPSPWRPRTPISFTWAPANPRCVRTSPSETAVYKSTDAGKTWQHMGLTDTRHIGKIIVDPHNPDIVLVAAVGHAYGPNPERGVFRSTDGGKPGKSPVSE